jgi:hypothetical protein
MWRRLKQLLWSQALIIWSQQQYRYKHNKWFWFFVF